MGIALTLGASGAARAQSGDSYAVGDDGARPAQNNPAQPPTDNPINENDTQSQGPVRLARFSYLEGNVSWREDESANWSDAGVNLPLRQSAQIYVPAHGRAEIQFDDGSLLRLGSGALVTLQTLYSDSEGEFTEIKLSEGLASLRTRNSRSVYQIDTPYVSVKTTGPSKLRVGAGEAVETAVMLGDATVEGSQGRADLHRGDYLYLDNADAAFAIRNLPRADSWERWNEQRDSYLEDAADRPSREHLPANIAIVAPDLDSYGTWRDDPDYGYVWCPRVTEAEWRPYSAGRWTWVQPFGWTWVSSEAWGWAPYHYGTWCHRNYGWAWCPGPVAQYWSPAVVHFSEYNGGVAWCPLAPREVRYPASLSIGFGGRDWSAFFSIGQAAVYYPTGNRYCEARPWNSNYVNHVTRITNITNINNINNVTNVYNNDRFVTNHNVVRNLPFTPYNAQNANGASSASLAAFSGRGAYRMVSRSEASVFSEGRAVTAPQAGQRPVAGPVIARPGAFSNSPTRTLTPGNTPSAAIENRRVFRAPLPQSVQRSGGELSQTGRARPTYSNGGSAGREVTPNRTRGGYTGNSGAVPNNPDGNAGGNGNNRGGYSGYNGNSGGVTRNPNHANPTTGNPRATPRRSNANYGTNNGTYNGTYNGNGNYPNTGRRTQTDTTPRSTDNRNGTASSDAAERARAARQSLGAGRGYGGPNGTYRQDPNAGRSSGGSGTTPTPRRNDDRPTDPSGAGGNRRNGDSRGSAGSGADTGRSVPRRDTAPQPSRSEPSRSQPTQPTRTPVSQPRRDTTPRSEPSRSQPPTRPEPARRDTPAPRSEPGRSAPARSDSGGGNSRGGGGGNSGGSRTPRH